MASVWIARLRGKRGFESLVAIKTVLPQHAGDAAFEQMFVDEARIMAGIRHPNVAAVLDVGETNGLLYLVFEWVQGDQLSLLNQAVHSAGEEFDVAIALRIMADACAGLHAAHSLCDPSGAPLMIVHRDVSPQNIMVTPAGSVKVIDFGVAKALHRLAGATDPGIIKGKLSYLAPEMARGEAIDRRIDVWAAGVVLYELIAGRLPIEGETRPATVMLIARGKRPAPLPGHLPASVVSVVEKALAADANDRFQTAGDMHRALEGVLVKEYGPITGDDVASYMARHLGNEVNERSRRIAAALERRLDIRQPQPPIVDDSYPSVSIGETSIEDLALDEILPDRVEPGPASAPRPRHRPSRLRTAIGLPLALLGTLAVLILVFVRRAPANPEPFVSSASPLHSAPVEPIASIAESATPVALLPEAGPPEPALSDSANPQDSPPKPKSPANAQPRKSSDPRSIFGSKR